MKNMLDRIRWTKVGPWALVLLGVISLLATWLLWSANTTTRTLVFRATATPAATEVATTQPRYQSNHEGNAEPEAADLAHRQTVLERFSCRDCHGVGKGWLMPDDHSTMAEEGCQECHVAAPEPLPISLHQNMEQGAEEPCGACHFDQVGLASVTTDAARLPSAASSAPAGCNSCHGGSAEDLLPSSHAERSQALSTCIVCHETQPLDSPAVPHRVEGWERCDFCHGEQRLTPLTGAHEGDVGGQCLFCHSVTQLPPTTHRNMVFVAHDEGGCMTCHAEDALAPLQDSHVDRAEPLCALCHNPDDEEEAPPIAPHPLARTTCKSCHSASLVGTLPLDHTDRGEDTCNVCHDEHPGGPPTIPHAIDNRADCTDCHQPSGPQP